MITIIGIGEDGLDGVASSARTLIEGAEILVGGARHLAMIPQSQAERHVWPSPFADARPLLDSVKARRVVVLASGDPMWFGAGATLAGWFAPDEVTIIAHPGAFSLAAARLNWPLHEVLCLTAHGRPVEALALHFAPGNRLFVLSEDETTPDKVRDLLASHLYGRSRLVVLERLGGPAERIIEGAGPFDPLNLIAIEMIADPGARVLPLVPGLPDEAFAHDGQLTKREIRAVTLAALAPLPGLLLWDVGAGNGSVAIEWMRAGGRAIAIEDHPDRAENIALNAARLGVPGLEIVRGRAPECLPYSDPDAVFVGGGVSVPGLLDACWQALRPGGRMVVNAVTIEAEAVLLAFHSANGGELTRLAVSRLNKTGGFHTWAPAAPVTQYVAVKP